MLLKLIAIFSMFIDHIAILYFYENTIMRIIGRMAFPIFAYLIVYNYMNRTSNKLSYIFILAIAGILSQPIYNYAFGHTFHLNVLILFSSGLIIIHMIESIVRNIKEKWNIFFNTIGISIAYNVVYLCEYNIIGLMVMLSFYLVQNTKKSYFFILGFLALIISTSYPLPILKLGIILSFFIIILHHYYPKIDNIIPYKKKSKWIFYLFYPLHLGFLRWIKL